MLQLERDAAEQPELDGVRIPPPPLRSVEPATIAILFPLRYCLLLGPVDPLSSVTRIV